MTQLTVFVLSGLGLSGTLALIALGLVLIMRATGVFNFAQGQFMLLPAILAAKLQLDGFPFWFCFVVGILCGSAIAALFYRFILERTVGLNHIFPVIATLGFASVLDGVMGLAFGTSNFSLEIPFLPTGTIVIFGAQFTIVSIVTALASLLLAAAVAVFIRFTRVGARLRAAGQDPLLASLGAINVRRVFVASWAVAAALAAVAGMAYASTTVVNSTVVSIALLAAPAIVIGGLDSATGAIVGSLIVGFLQAFTATFIGGQYVEVMSYILLLLVLQFFPQGLFGTKQIVRA
ncbi:branched-chain amino acid ABC transporter permease [soil metagenome]